MYSVKLITTEDGSHSFFVPELNETFHSVHGAITESRHVFIRNGFRYLLSSENPDTVQILEVGLGTGLNVLLTLLENRKYRKEIIYTALEPFPLPDELWPGLNYPGQLGDNEMRLLIEKIHTFPWEEKIILDEKFNFFKIKKSYQDYSPGNSRFDIIYYDAFAPGKQPGMWEIDLIRKSADLLKDQGCFVTYAAKGQLKRDLKSAGLIVETLPGPPGKKEMTRAVKR